jgi:phage baseplate assembly protein W
MSHKISSKRIVLVFGAASLLFCFSRFAEGVSIGPPFLKYKFHDSPRCREVIQLHPRKVTDIEGGRRIEFSWRDTPYWIDVKNGKGGNLEKPVEWSNRRYEPRLSLASVLGTIRIEGEDILQLDTAWDGQAIILLTKKDNHITFRVYLNEYTPEFDSEYIEVPRDPELPRSVFYLSHQSLLPGVKKGDLSFYSRENTRLVVGDIGSKFFYVVGPSGEPRIAMADFDDVSQLPALVDQNITPTMSDIFVTYRDGEGNVHGATVYELSTFLVMAVHLPKQNSNGIGWPHWIGDWSEERGSLISSQMLAFLGISMEEAKLMSSRPIGMTKERLQRLFGPLYFGANP